PISQTYPSITLSLKTKTFIATEGTFMFQFASSVPYEFLTVCLRNSYGNRTAKRKPGWKARICAVFAGFAPPTRCPGSARVRQPRLHASPGGDHRNGRNPERTVTPPRGRGRPSARGGGRDRANKRNLASSGASTRKKVING